MNLLSGPGAGKTELLELVLTRCRERGVPVAALTGDLATENDARRLVRSGVPVRQVVTDGLCHLEADLVRDHLAGWLPAGTRLLTTDQPLITTAPPSTAPTGGTPWPHCSGSKVEPAAATRLPFLNAEEPSAVDLVTDFGVEVIWHPSLGPELGDAVQQIMRDCASGARQVDIFVYEGSVLMRPGGSGRYDMFAGRPMKDWAAEIAPKAGVVVAVGDCSSWGGIPATPPNPTDAIGLQYLKG